MRLRKKWWARKEMEQSKLMIINPIELKGKWKDNFQNDNDIHLELGCGMGRFISQKAKSNPNINIIGVDLKDEILVYALRKIISEEVVNARLMPLNIAFIDEVFDKNEIGRIYINFCNPWPKERHKKRRLTHTTFLKKYKKFIKPKAQIWFKTDNTELFEESIEYFKEEGFNIKFMTYDLHNSGFSENIVTEYEEKFTNLGMKTMFLIAELM